MTIKQRVEQKLEASKADFIAGLKVEIEEQERADKTVGKIMEGLMYYYRKYISDMLAELTLEITTEWVESGVLARNKNKPYLN